MKSKTPIDDEELEILQAWEAGVLKPVSGMATQIKDHRAVAEATFKKDQRLNIRISSRDLKNLQARALEEGCSLPDICGQLAAQICQRSLGEPALKGLKGDATLCLNHGFPGVNYFQALNVLEICGVAGGYDQLVGHGRGGNLSIFGGDGVPVACALRQDEGIGPGRHSVKCKAMVGKVLLKHQICRRGQCSAALAFRQQSDSSQNLGLRDGADVHGAACVLSKPVEHGGGRPVSHQFREHVGVEHEALAHGVFRSGGVRTICRSGSGKDSACSPENLLLMRSAKLTCAACSGATIF